MYIYIYVFIYLFIFSFMYLFLHSPIKRSFRGPGGVVGGLDMQHVAKICAREKAYVVSRGLPWSPAACFKPFSPNKRSIRGLGGAKVT